MHPSPFSHICFLRSDFLTGTYPLPSEHGIAVTIAMFDFTTHPRTATLWPLTSVFVSARLPPIHSHHYCEMTCSISRVIVKGSLWWGSVLGGVHVCSYMGWVWGPYMIWNIVMMFVIYLSYSGYTPDQLHDLLHFTIKSIYGCRHLGGSIRFMYIYIYRERERKHI